MSKSNYYSIFKLFKDGLRLFFPLVLITVMLDLHLLLKLFQPPAAFDLGLKMYVLSNIISEWIKGKRVVNLRRNWYIYLKKMISPCAYSSLVVGIQLSISLHTVLHGALVPLSVHTEVWHHMGHRSIRGLVVKPPAPLVSMSMCPMVGEC